MDLMVNGIPRDLRGLDPGLSLLVYLREHLDLTGVKDGCAIGVCGACTVLLDGHAVKACVKTLREVVGRQVLTIEGLAPREGLHPLQQAFLDAGAVQCGFCIPGMILTSHAFLLQNPNPTRAQIRRAISPNLCRCTGYQQIIDAVERAAPGYPR